MTLNAVGNNSQCRPLQITGEYRRTHPFVMLLVWFNHHVFELCSPLSDHHNLKFHTEQDNMASKFLYCLGTQ